MKNDNVDPSIKGFFPWALFLALAVLLLLASMIVRAEAQEPDVWACYGPAREEAISMHLTPCNEMSNICVRVREFLSSGHTIEEGRALAAEKHIPQWIINKAERCVK